MDSTRKSFDQPAPIPSGAPTAGNETTSVSPIPLPAARRVQAPWHCYADKDGTAAVTLNVSGRDRTGLLLTLVNFIHQVDPDLRIDGACGARVEAYCSVFMLVRGERLALAKLCDRANGLSGRPPEGWRIAVARVVQLLVRGPFRLTFLQEVCATLSAGQINISAFKVEPYTQFAPGTDLLRDPTSVVGAPTYELRLTLEFPQEAADRLDEIPARLARLDPACSVELIA